MSTPRRASLDCAVASSACMDNWTFGWTLALIGGIGTMLVLWILSLLILLIKKVFPCVPEDPAARKG